MILFYSDVHLGQRTYGTQHESGYYTSELDTINALESILETAKNPEVDLIICGGDFFHSNRPTSSNIKYAVDWFQRMDALNKKHYIIPGNHDASAYDHAISFIHSLNLKNTYLIDTYSPNNLEWNGWSITFVPYQPSLMSSKDKDKYFYSNISKALASAENKTIIITHIQEKSALVGSEATLISRGVDLVDIEEFDHNKKVLVLTGHVHRPQVYNKSTLTIAYPGSINYINKSDLGTSKGFYLVDADGEIEFSEIKNIRKFIKYTIPKNIEVEDYFKSIRMIQNQVAFINITPEHIIDEQVLRNYFSTYNSIIGSFTIIKEDEISNDDLQTFSEVTEPHVMFTTFIDTNYKESSEQYINDLLLKGKEYLDKYSTTYDDGDI